MGTDVTALNLYDAAKRALAEAHRVDEVKRIRDEAVAIQAYAQQAKDTSLITKATEIRMRAERRAGELLRDMAERKERHSGRGHTRTVGSRAATPRPEPKLSDLGINKTQSSRWQALAVLDTGTFESKLENASKRAYDSMTSRLLKEEKIKRVKERHAQIIEHGCTVDDLHVLIESGKRFGVIYADPPWPWDTWGGPSGKVRSAPDNHYGTSVIAEIASLPVAALAAENCALLMWCTCPHITIATHVPVIERWSFRPCTFGFDWVKTNVARPATPKREAHRRCRKPSPSAASSRSATTSDSKASETSSSKRKGG
jgi:hypothetical protein